MASIKLAARKIGHTATGVWSVHVVDQMISVSFVTVSNDINEPVITDAYTDALTDELSHVSLTV